MLDVEKNIVYLSGAVWLLLHPGSSSDIAINREFDLQFQGNGGVDSLQPMEMTSAALTVGFWIVFTASRPEDATYFRLAKAQYVTILGSFYR